MGKIIVCSPSNVTGGPELLHQLVYELRKNNKDAYISYYPFNRNINTPSVYKKYLAPVTKLKDESDCFIIIPESATWITKLIKNANIGIWWLSVDNYYRKTGDFAVKDKFNYFFGLITGQIVKIDQLKNYTHFAQSYYAYKFLSDHGIIPHFLGDKLSDTHLKDFSNFSIKKNIVAYNPKKGLRRTLKIIKENPDLLFVPVVGNQTEVRNLLEISKVYIDFGHHPGKDRLPREAAMAGCCVITNKRGSAFYKEDVPIPEKYKIDDFAIDYLQKTRNLILEIFENFNHCIKDFFLYKKIIIKEEILFSEQVKNIFC